MIKKKFRNIFFWNICENDEIYRNNVWKEKTFLSLFSWKMEKKKYICIEVFCEMDFY